MTVCIRTELLKRSSSQLLVLPLCTLHFMLLSVSCGFFVVPLVELLPAKHSVKTEDVDSDLVVKAVCLARVVAVIRLIINTLATLHEFIFFFMCRTIHVLLLPTCVHAMDCRYFSATESPGHITVIEPRRRHAKTGLCSLLV